MALPERTSHARREHRTRCTPLVRELPPHRELSSLFAHLRPLPSPSTSTVWSRRRAGAGCGAGPRWTPGAGEPLVPPSRHILGLVEGGGMASRRDRRLVLAAALLL